MLPALNYWCSLYRIRHHHNIIVGEMLFQDRDSTVPEPVIISGKKDVYIRQKNNDAHPQKIAGLLTPARPRMQGF
jgi:hypothetical protein